MSPAAPLLHHLLSPLGAWLRDPVTEDIAVNRPGEAWIRQRGQWLRDDVALDGEALEEIAILAGSLRKQEVGALSPLCATELPDGERLQICLPPAVPQGSVSLTIRKHEDRVAPLAKLASRYRAHDWNRWRNLRAGRDMAELLALYDSGDLEGFLAAAVRARLNMLLCGRTGSGKTTLSKSVLAAIDPGERLVTIEDTLELTVLQPNQVRLLYSKACPVPRHGDGLSGAAVDAEALLQASLRMRPDRVLLQELRDDAAWTYVNEVTSGHPGSVTTIHGYGAAEAFRRLFALAKSSPKGAALQDGTLIGLIAAAIDVIIPLEEKGGVFDIGGGLVCGRRRPARRDRGRSPARDVMIPIPLAAWIAAGVGLYLTLFTVLATLFFLFGTGLIGTFAHPYWQWWLYALWYSGNPVVRAWLEVSGVPAAVLPLVVAGSVWYRRRRVRGWTLRANPAPARPVAPPIRGTTDNYGHARWALIEEAQALWPGPNRSPGSGSGASPGAGFGGVVVGEAYDPRQARGSFSPGNPATWGEGGRAPLLVDPCVEGSTHSLVVAGSGSFKTTSAVSTLLTWTGSAVVLDPAAELGPMLEAARREMGHRVFVLSPDHAAACGFNVLDWIDTASPLAETDVGAVVEWICGTSTAAADATAEFFESRGKALVTCLLAHMLWDPALPPPARKTLRTLRAAVAAPESKLRDILDGIHQDSPSPLARDLAGTLKELEDRTFSGIAATAAAKTDWLSTRAFADLVSGNSFKTLDVINGQTDIFVCLPLKALQSTPAVARCVIGALLNAAYEANGAVSGRILFLLDEAFRLGRMDIIEIARDAGRKYGITLQLLYQSVGQIVEQWGEAGKRAWYESAAWRAYAAVKDPETARELSETIGNYGVLAWSEAQNSGTHGRQLEVRSRSRGHNVTYSESIRPLIRPEEIMHDLREDAQIVIPKRGRPVLCGRAIYFRRPGFAELAGANRFFASKESING